MILKKLTLKNYRNFKNTMIEPCNTVNIIYGDNAQGKTNLIEAIWLFTGNSSFRSSKINELIHFGESVCDLLIEFEDSKRNQNATIKISNKKEFLLNKVPLKKSGEMTGHFYSVIFSPIDLNLADGSPKNRRKFLDSAISQITPQYHDYFEQYERVLEQRNALLKDMLRFPALKDTIDIWDMQLAKLGTILSIYRNDYVEKLSVLVQKIYFGLSSQSEHFLMKYRSTIFEQVNLVKQYEDQYINQYYEMLQQNLKQDMKNGFTSVGIHRDDLELFINDLPIRVYGSRGQIRSSVLSLKLAEAELLRRVTGENPIMLLDDVMSELDNKRQDYILNHVKDKQVFITCCDVFNTVSLKHGKIFHIEKGNVISEQFQS